MVLLLLTFCLLLLPLWESVIVLCFVVRYFMSILVLQSSWWGRESWLLCLICLPGVSWWLTGSSSRCHGVVCGLWLWYFLIILTHYFCLFYKVIYGLVAIDMPSNVVHPFRTLRNSHTLGFRQIQITVYYYKYSFGIETTRRQNNSSTHFLRQLVDKLWDNSSTLYETTCRHFCSKLIDLWLIIIIGNQVQLGIIV